MLRTLAYKSTLGILTNWLTANSLAHSSARIMLLKTLGFKQQVTWPKLLGGNILDHVYLKGDDMSIQVKTINLSTVTV